MPSGFPVRKEPYPVRKEGTDLPGEAANSAPERRNGGLGYLRSCSAGNRILEGNDDRLDVARGSGNRRDRAGGLVLPGDGPAQRQHGAAVMTSHPEGGYGCRHCDWTGWTYEGTERASAGPDPTPDVTPTPCPHCTPPSVPEMDPSDDDWGMNLYCEEEIVCD